LPRRPAEEKSAIVLRFLSRPTRGHGLLTRREWLRLGGLGLAALAAQAAPAARPAAFPGLGKARSVLLIYTSGGQSQLDTWDPKPDAPEEVRGLFRPVATSVPGTLVCEHMPRLARLAHLYTILRSASHDDLDHGSASYLALTGHFHAKKSGNPPPRPTDAPTYGALLHRVRPHRHLPYSAVHVNGPAQVPETLAPGQDGGFLGRGCDPLLIGDPTREPLALPGLDAREDLPPVRLEARRSLLQSLELYRRDLEANTPAGDLNTLYRQAYQLLDAPRFRQAFDLAREPLSVRERYGLHRSGQALLLGRRLVEAGVPWVTVIWNHNNRGQDRAPDQVETYGWDTHNDIFDLLKDHLLPRFDQSFAALLLDLEQRGLLRETLVVCMGEFGRAPQVALESKFAGASPGRKHWASVYSLVLAGAGVARGGLFGASDRLGAYPRTPPVGPWDIAATMFAALGVDPATPYQDPAGRLFPLTTGTPIGGLFG
jgi:hypothetical protein